MLVTVHFMAQLRTAAGAESLQLELAQDATLRDVAAKAAERCGESLRAILLNDKGQPRSGVLAFSGDQQVGWDDTIKSGGEVTLLSGMSGG